MAPLALLRHPALRGVRAGLVCAVAAWAILRLPPARGVEDWLLDGCFAARGTRATAARVVIIGLDGPSLAALPGSRLDLSPQLAEVISFARAQGATAIGVDLLIPEDRRDLPELQLGRVGDAWTVGQAVWRAGNVTLPQWRLEDGWLRPLPAWRLKADHDPDLADLGFVNIQEDGDQFVRRQLLLGTDGDRLAPSMALALYARARGRPLGIDAEGRPTVGGEVIPTDADGTVRINYVGPPGTIEEIPFRRVLEMARTGGGLPQLGGAVVIIGITARDQQDYHATPYANHYAQWTAATRPGLMAGAEVHANAVATLVDRAHVRTPPWLAPLPWILAAGAGLGWLFSRMSLEAGFAVAVAHHFAWKALAHLAFRAFNWRVEMAAMLLLGGLAYATVFALRWRTLRRMFGVVKSEALARSLEADPRRLDAGGEERTVTVLFADVRGFTDFSEKHRPAEVVALLNAYFAAVVPLIEAEGGVIDKFMGDGIMALFGAPAHLPDHALRAARAAVAMVRAVHERHAEWAKHGKAGLRIGVGVHTGPVVVGAIGGPGRLDYTAIGDTVNAAARIESENKTQGTEVLLSAATAAALSPEERCRLGVEVAPRPTHVKGKDEELLLYAVSVP